MKTYLDMHNTEHTGTYARINWLFAKGHGLYSMHVEVLSHKLTSATIKTSSLITMTMNLKEYKSNYQIRIHADVILNCCIARTSKIL